MLLMTYLCTQEINPEGR